MCTFEVPTDTPKLTRYFARQFIDEWNEIFKKVNGVGRSNLIELAIKLNIHRYSKALLISNQPRDRIIGIVTLGNMKNRDVWEIFSSICKSSSIILSLASLRALSQINTERTFEEFTNLMLSRQDWPPSLLIKIIKESNNAIACEYFSKVSQDIPTPHLERLVQFSGKLNCFWLVSDMQNILNKNESDEIVVICLKSLFDPVEIDIAQKYLNHDNWLIRLNAVSALGRIGSESDIPAITERLLDEDWWVRFRAAQSLVNLPCVNKKIIHGIFKKLSDDFAIDALNQALAEKNL